MGELLDRYSRDELGEGDRRRLFEAALEDQAVFDALAEEDALRELLDDASARRAVLRRLGATASTGRRWLPALSLAASLVLAVGAGYLTLRSPA